MNDGRGLPHRNQDVDVVQTHVDHRRPTNLDSPEGWAACREPHPMLDLLLEKGVEPLAMRMLAAEFALAVVDTVEDEIDRAMCMVAIQTGIAIECGRVDFSECRTAADAWDLPDADDVFLSDAVFAAVVAGAAWSPGVAATMAADAASGAAAGPDVDAMAAQCDIIRRYFPEPPPVSPELMWTHDQMFRRFCGAATTEAVLMKATEGGCRLQTALFFLGARVTPKPVTKASA